jgi:hypothetical protein
MFWNIVLLANVAFLPFAASVLASAFHNGAGERAAVVFYGATFTIGSGLFNLTWHHTCKPGCSDQRSMTQPRGPSPADSSSARSCTPSARPSARSSRCWASCCSQHPARCSGYPSAAVPPGNATTPPQNPPAEPDLPHRQKRATPWRACWSPALPTDSDRWPPGSCSSRDTPSSSTPAARNARSTPARPCPNTRTSSSATWPASRASKRPPAAPTTATPSTPSSTTPASATPNPAASTPLTDWNTYSPSTCSPHTRSQPSWIRPSDWSTSAPGCTAMASRRSTTRNGRSWSSRRPPPRAGHQAWLAVSDEPTGVHLPTIG